ncbi:voltage-activated ion channel, putative [Pediculus humanus corporis]|uniref:Voltage-activated ion channel, putative n=1 Tax=Pediculus humanus subsp. corporis TaxID=121224 RepID=E0VDL8_PEDHC|nr:voltage-activated ion channel, putative [Pediculus humanus corporis]EEB11474.1 voltage-activated ion channel, putative [Pediculus humanus corporis]
MKDYTCVYTRHDCELRKKQLSEMTKKEKFKDSIIQRIFLASQFNYQSLHYLRSKGAVQLEINRQKFSSHWYIFHPFSMGRFVWQIFMFFIFMVSVYYCPIRAAFFNSLMAKYLLMKNKNATHIMKTLWINVLLDIIWLINSFGYFITGYYDESTDKVILNPKTIAKRYLSTGFFIDITTSIPLEATVAFIFGLKAYSEMNHNLFIFLHVYNIYSNLRYHRHVVFCYKNRNASILSNLSLRLLASIIVYTIIIIYTVYFNLIFPQMIYGTKLFLRRAQATLSWVQVGEIYHKDFLNQLKYSVSKAVQGYVGATDWEEIIDLVDYILAILFSNLGRFCTVYCVIWFLQCITAANVLRTKFNLITDQLKTYMKQKEIPIYMKKRLNRFYFYRFQSHYFRGRALLDKLPKSLRKEISMYTCQKLLHSTEVFQSVPKKILTRFTRKMYREMYFPQDVIVRANTYGESMYFICSGTVSVSTSNDVQIMLLHDGDFFGEIALISDNRRRIATVTAVTITELYRLEEFDYKKIIQSYPDVFNRLEKIAIARFKMLLTVEKSIIEDS